MFESSDEFYPALYRSIAVKIPVVLLELLIKVVIVLFGWL